MRCGLYFLTPTSLINAPMSPSPSGSQMSRKQRPVAIVPLPDVASLPTRKDDSRVWSRSIVPAPESPSYAPPRHHGPAQRQASESASDPLFRQRKDLSASAARYRSADRVMRPDSPPASGTSDMQPVSCPPSHDSSSFEAPRVTLAGFRWPYSHIMGRLYR